MQMVTERIRWCASDDEASLFAWTADRASAAGRHLVPVVAVGRQPDGRLVVEVERPTGTPLSAALDTIGVPTAGVAVTLTVPLLELAAAERAGAVRLGTAGLDDVLVDDAGAVVLCDRPPGAETVSSDADADAGAASAGPDAASATPHTASATPGAAATARPGSAPAASTGRRPSDQPGGRVLVLAARVVWERTDDRDAARPAVDAALAEALDGDLASVHSALSAVRAAAAPRPVWWEPTPLDLVVAPPSPVVTADASLLGVVRDVLERGVPVGDGRRLPFRRAVVGAVVACGLTAAAVFALG